MKFKINYFFKAYAFKQKFATTRNCELPLIFFLQVLLSSEWAASDQRTHIQELKVNNNSPVRLMSS